MKLPSFTVLKNTAMVSGIVAGLAGTVMFWQVFAVYGCATESFEGTGCNLDHMQIIIVAARTIMTVAALILTLAIIGIILRNDKKSK